MSSPDVLNFLKVTTNFTEWFSLGTYLQLSHEDLVHIEQQYSNEGTRRCKIELFYLWTKSCPEASWEQLADSLKDMGLGTLANQIYKNHIPSLAATAESQALEPEKGRVVHLELDRKTVELFTELERDYAVIVCNLLTSLEESLKAEDFSLKYLQRYLQARLGQIFDDNITTVDGLFNCISSHYDLFHTDLLEEVIDRFVKKGPLKTQLSQYNCQLDEFTNSTKIALLKEVRSKSGAPVEGMPQVTFKLTGFWLDVTIKRFQTFVDKIFKDESNALTHISVKVGCICVTWFAPKSAISSLVTQAKRKIQFMRLVGVLSLTIADTVIIEQIEGNGEGINLSSALLHATEEKCAKAVKFLLSLGADPDSTSTDGGNTPLMIACMYGSFSIAKLLIEDAKAKVNLQNEQGASALTWACWSKTHNVNLVGLLIRYGANVNDRGKNVQTPLGTATINGHTSIVHYLLDKGADVNAADSYGVTALMCACLYKRSDIIELLLKYGASVNAQGQNNKGAIHIASIQQMTDCVELLLIHDADPNLQCFNGLTPLMLACICVNESLMNPAVLVKLLSVGRGADPNIQSDDGFTALMTASKHNYQDGVKVLLNAGAKVNVQNSSGSTALHEAAEDGFLKISELLLEAGAHVLLKNKLGLTPPDLALRHGHKEVCKLMRKHLRVMESGSVTVEKYTEQTVADEDHSIETEI